MTEKTENGVSAFDTIKLILAAALVLGGIVAYYYYAQAPVLARGGGVLLAIVAAAVLTLQSEPGRTLWHFMQASRVELRKVVWPTRDETLRTTLVIIVVVIILSLLLGLIDVILKWVVLDHLLKLGR